MVIHRVDNQHGMPALTVSPDGRHVTCNECRLWSDLAEDVITGLQVALVQGPAGAPFRPGDRFRWTSGNGLTVRTGTILEWQPFLPGTVLAARSWGSWFVEVDPLPRPRGAKPRKKNPWDGFRTWFTGNEMGLVERVP